jgi:hypothetical protein
MPSGPPIHFDGLSAMVTCAARGRGAASGGVLYGKEQTLHIRHIPRHSCDIGPDMFHRLVEFQLRTAGP